MEWEKVRLVDKNGNYTLHAVLKQNVCNNFTLSFNGGEGNWNETKNRWTLKTCFFTMNVTSYWVEASSKKEKGLMVMDNSVVIAEGKGCEGTKR